MKVLFFVDRFPTYSETFIRDQIMALIDEGVDVYIYPKNGRLNHEEIQALSDFESYQLEHRILDLDQYHEVNRVKRFFKGLLLLLSKIGHPHFKYYVSALSVKTYGTLARSLRLFFRVHVLLKHQIDIIHAHFGPNGNHATVFKRLGMPLKLFTTFHGYDIRLGLEKGGQIYNPLFKYADEIFAISDYNYQHLLHFGAPEPKLILLPNGIDLNFYKTEKGTTSDSKQIKTLTVARLVDEKGIELAIKAIGKVIASQPELDLTYTVIGDGEKRAELERLIEREGLLKTITLVGYKTSAEVRDYMVASDLFLLPSRAEALPTVLLEAQACGLVVLATDVGAVKSMVKGGLVVSPTVEAITEGLLSLIAQSTDWDQYKNNGTAYVRTHYDLKAQTKKLLTYYRI